MIRERDYELGLVLSPETSDEEQRALISRITSQVTAADGRVLRVSAWGRKRLAYPISVANKHHRDGIYFFLDMQMRPSVVAELDRDIRVNETIIRYLIKARDAQAIAEERVKAAEEEVRQRELAAQQAAEAEAEAERARQAQALAEANAESPAASATDEGSEPAAEQPAQETPTEEATPESVASEESEGE